MYKLNQHGVTRMSDNAGIPLADGNSDYEQYKLWLAEGNTPEPADLPTQAEIIKALTDKVQTHMDKEAQKLGYDNLISACSYAAGTTANKYKTEGLSFLNWRSNVWDYCFTLMTDVQAGTIPMPTEAELIAWLPARV